MLIALNPFLSPICIIVLFFTVLFVPFSITKICCIAIRSVYPYLRLSLGYKSLTKFSRLFLPVSFIYWINQGLPSSMHLTTQSIWMPWLFAWTFVVFIIMTGRSTVSPFECILSIFYRRHSGQVSPWANFRDVQAMSCPPQVFILRLRSTSRHWLWYKTLCTSRSPSTHWWRPSARTVPYKECCSYLGILIATELGSKRPSCRNTASPELKSIFICCLINR